MARAPWPPPPPLRHVPGPVLLVAARYETSPVGPYTELALSQPVRVGRRVGTHVPVIGVSSAASRAAGRARWSLPKVLGALRWSASADGAALVWEERAITARARRVGPPFPAVLLLRSLQIGPAGPVRARVLTWGWGRLARIEVTVGPDDPLAWVAGRRLGLYLTHAGVTMHPARPARSR